MLGSGRVLRSQPPNGRLLALSFMITISAGLLMLLVRTILAEAENRELALAEAAALAKTHALQSQINPHFFFNTLTTVSALAELDSRAARELVGLRSCRVRVNAVIRRKVGPMRVATPSLAAARL